MSTCSVLIGNSDDKLPQARWAAYILDAGAVVQAYAGKVHFVGFSDPRVMWQNACYVFEMNPNNHQALRDDLADLAERFGQDSIAFVTGETELVTPK